jgi:Zn finger protein HypA/HybF involved in hydrogenase expression
MHDFMLAKEIGDEVKKIVEDKKLTKVDKVTVEIGKIAMAHDGHEEHIEDISIENLNFGLETVVKGTILEKTFFDIKKIEGDNWRITDIEGE